MSREKQVSAEHVKSLMKKNNWARIRKLAQEGHTEAQAVLNNRQSARAIKIAEVPQKGKKAK